VWTGFPTNSRPSPTENLKSKHVNSNYPTHIAKSDTTQTGLFCRVCCGSVNWVGPTARQVRSVSGLCRSASGGAVRPPDALRRGTHLSGGQFTPPYQTRQDHSACQSTAAAATQARQAATPSRLTAHTQRRCRPTPRKCKHAVDCCIWLNLNCIKRHATRAIYRLAVQTLPDGLETQFTPPDTTQTAPSCRVWRPVWIGHYNINQSVDLWTSRSMHAYEHAMDYSCVP